MSMATDIADAVAVELNIGNFGDKFTAERVTIPRFEIEELAELHVSVIPKSISFSRASKTISKYIVTIDIGIQKKIAENPLAEVALLGDVVDEIASYLQDRTLGLLPNVRWIACKNDPIYSVEHMVQKRVFTSVLSVEYHLLK